MPTRQTRVIVVATRAVIQAAVAVAMTVEIQTMVATAAMITAVAIRRDPRAMAVTAPTGAAMVMTLPVAEARPSNTRYCAVDVRSGHRRVFPKWNWVV